MTVVVLDSLFHLLQLLYLLLVVFLVLRLLSRLFLFVFLCLLLLLQQAGSVGNPCVVLFLVEFPNVPLFDAVVVWVFSPQVEQIVDVIELIVGLLYVLLKTLQLEVYLEPFLTANVAF